MNLKGLFKRFWESEKETSKEDDIEDLPSADDATFYRKAKLYLQRFDEYITASEAEIETLSIELDNCIEQESDLQIQLKQLNKNGTWQERHLLLKLDRLQLHCENLKRQIEIYSQNIRVYLALISKIQAMKAMRMFGGVNENKMESIWLDFKETLEKYKSLLMSESATHDSEKVTLPASDDRLSKLKKSITTETEEQKKLIIPDPEMKTRPPLELHQSINSTPPQEIENKIESRRMLTE